MKPSKEILLLALSLIAFILIAGCTQPQEGMPDDSGDSVVVIDPDTSTPTPTPAQPIPTPVPDPIIPPTPCQEAWDCSEWESCENGNQTRICSDTNLCGTVENKPAVSQECTVIAEVTNCTDTDGGKNYFEKGRVTAEKESIVFSDLCLSSTRLKEVYCDATKQKGIGSENITCEFGCENDACKQGVSNTGLFGLIGSILGVN